MSLYPRIQFLMIFIPTVAFGQENAPLCFTSNDLTQLRALLAKQADLPEPIVHLSKPIRDVVADYSVDVVIVEASGRFSYRRRPQFVLWNGKGAADDYDKLNGVENLLRGPSDGPLVLGVTELQGIRDLLKILQKLPLFQALSERIRELLEDPSYAILFIDPSGTCYARTRAAMKGRPLSSDPHDYDRLLALLAEEPLKSFLEGRREEVAASTVGAIQNVYACTKAVTSNPAVGDDLALFAGSNLMDVPDHLRDELLEHSQAKMFLTMAYTKAVAVDRSAIEFAKKDIGFELSKNLKYHVLAARMLNDLRADQPYGGIVVDFDKFKLEGDILRADYGPLRFYAKTSNKGTEPDKWLRNIQESLQSGKLELYFRHKHDGSLYKCDRDMLVYNFGVVARE